jgi:hypothetical protein
MSHGNYLKCDCCGYTIGSTQATPTQEPPSEMRRRAAALGWVQYWVASGGGTVGDACANCANEARRSNVPPNLRL